VMKCEDVGHKKMRGGVIGGGLYVQDAERSVIGIWQMANHRPRLRLLVAQRERYKDMHLRENWIGPNYGATPGKYGAREPSIDPINLPIILDLVAPKTGVASTIRSLATA